MHVRTARRHFVSRMTFLLCSVCILVLVGLHAAIAHPEDEFCSADSGMDPELCRQLTDALDGTGELAKLFFGEDGGLRSPFETGLQFAEVGINHILPGGTDHILFVLALFLASQRLRPLIIQISAFTVAHTATLGLTASGVLDPPAFVVEPLIAASIAFVALENVYFKDMTRWRPVIVFGFGLFHGMGFAGFVREVGLPLEQFWSSLIGFNIGVEIGQLAVVALAALLSVPVVRALAHTPFSYRQVVVIPASLIIAVIGLWWAVSRSLGL